MIEQSAAGEMRHQAFRFPDAEIDRRLTEEERHQLAVDIGDMEEGDVADGREGEEFGLRETLLRESARPAGGYQGRCCGGYLEKVSP